MHATSTGNTSWQTGRTSKIMIMETYMDKDVNDMGALATRWRAMHAVDTCHGNLV